MLHLGLLIAAVVVFLVSAFVNPPRVSLVSIGLALFAAAFISGIK